MPIDYISITKVNRKHDFWVQEISSRLYCLLSWWFFTNNTQFCLYFFLFWKKQKKKNPPLQKKKKKKKKKYSIIIKQERKKKKSKKQRRKLVVGDVLTILPPEVCVSAIEAKILHLKNKNAASFGGATGRCCHSNIIETSTCWRASWLVCSHPDTDAEHSLVHLRSHIPSRWASNHRAHTVISPVRRLKPTLYNLLAAQLDSSPTVVVVFLQLQFFFFPHYFSRLLLPTLSTVLMYFCIHMWVVGWDGDDICESD